VASIRRDTAAVAITDQADGSPDYGPPLYRARLGLLLGLISISILFVTVTAVFFLMRHGAPVFDYAPIVYIREWVEVTLPVRLLLINTLVLLLSSVTIEMARRAVAREMALEPIRSLRELQWRRSVEFRGSRSL